MKIKKTIPGHGIGGLRGERTVIREFKYSDDGYNFLNKQTDNKWNEYKGELKAGIYVFMGGTYHNVKKLDPSVLAHC